LVSHYRLRDGFGDHFGFSFILVPKYLFSINEAKRFNLLGTYTLMYWGSNMGRINAIIPDDLERKFRTQATQKFLRKGSVGLAVTEAIGLWLKQEELKDKK
jgi:hypothetical protein